MAISTTIPIIATTKTMINTPTTHYSYYYYYNSDTTTPAYLVAFTDLGGLQLAAPPVLGRTRAHAVGDSPASSSQCKSVTGLGFIVVGVEVEVGVVVVTVVVVEYYLIGMVAAVASSRSSSSHCHRSSSSSGANGGVVYC